MAFCIHLILYDVKILVCMKIEVFVHIIIRQGLNEIAYEEDKEGE